MAPPHPQTYVEDCQVCCKPNVLRAEYDRDLEEFAISAKLEAEVCGGLLRKGGGRCDARGRFTRPKAQNRPSEFLLIGGNICGHELNMVRAQGAKCDHRAEACTSPQLASSKGTSE